eukprot:scaffold44657_cov71-Phaeocystis_antarctica.AAC.3
MHAVPALPLPRATGATMVAAAFARGPIAHTLARSRQALCGDASKSMPGYPAASSGSEKVPMFAPMSMKLPPAASSCIMSPMILRRVRSLPACAHEPVSSSPLETMWSSAGGCT